ncbi:SAM-dependent methyltransferase [Nocardioides sp. BE266]|uniref:class I SAM-dependent methyltransferase n=1 Tax=Nocardioides sp. BE266 TaxID=2817725 RepID=UPI00285F2115|nr:class I SAM-dependent methyltransferase [Nocardioides sp. BE266]MDR7252132.1 SAM-dependent methyltransferase [Nocardioides sp. BE266]
MSDFEGLNEATYRQAGIVDEYAAQESLHEGEERLLERVGDLSGARMLDIGVGAGRTTAHFLDRVGSYVGIDYSPELVDACRRRFPGADVSVGDARDLSRFADGSFDLVLFSFNGIDYVADEGRRRVLAEVRRVLADGGHFMFSSHNRDYSRLGKLPWQDARPGRTMLKQSAHALLHTRRRREMRRRELVGRDHVLVNDNAHDWSLLTYYISPPDQVRQLADAGFADAECFDQWGRPSATDEASVWRHYLAR